MPTADQIMGVASDAWRRGGIQDANELFRNPEALKNLVSTLSKTAGKGTLGQDVFNGLEASNFHTENEILRNLGSFGKDVKTGAFPPSDSSRYGAIKEAMNQLNPQYIGGVAGMGMAGAAGLGLGLLGNWALRQYGSTLVMKQEADTAQQIARALEASQMNSSRDRAYSQDGTNTR